MRLARSLLRLLFCEESVSVLFCFVFVRLEEEEREFVEVMEEVEFEREWRVMFDVELLSGELGQELCGEVGGVGGRGGRSAGVSFITCASGEIGTGTHSPSDITTVGWTVITL